MGPSTCAPWFPTSLSFCFSHIPCGQLDGSLCHLASWCVGQDKAQNILFLWYSCTFLYGTAIPIAFCWVSSCPLFWWGWRALGGVTWECLQDFQRFPAPIGLHPFLLHLDPFKMPSTPDVVSPLSYPLTIVSHGKIHVHVLPKLLRKTYTYLTLL